MKKFIEVTVAPCANHPSGYTNLWRKRLIDLNTISTIYEGSENVIGFDDGDCVSVSADSYNAVRDALLKGSTLEDGGTIGKMRSRIEELKECRTEDNSIANKMCELQHDHSWTIHAMANLLLWLRNPKDRKPSVLLDVYDENLRGLFETCFDEADRLNKRISELEETIRVMTEPKRSSGV